MSYYIDREEQRRRQVLAKQTAAAKKAKANLDEKMRKQKIARKELIKTTKHSRWHAERLSYQDRQVGYTGEMAEARHYLRTLTPRNYYSELKPFADADSTTTILEVEFAAVSANLKEWTERGKQVLFQQALAKYQQERAAFEDWQARNPGSTDWQRKPASKAQWMLIHRTSDTLGLTDVPMRLTCGEAYDWLQQHGGNLRFSDEPDDRHVDKDVADETAS